MKLQNNINVQYIQEICRRMGQHQSATHISLAHGRRRGPACGQALLPPAPPHAFDHADVIGSITDGQCHRPLVLLHQFYHLGLLEGRHPAADHPLAHARRPQQFQLQVSF